mgnify:CR=1 FL=1
MLEKKRQMGVSSYKLAVSAIRRAEDASENEGLTGLELLNYMKAAEVAFEIWANVVGIPRRPQTKATNKLTLEMVESEPIQEIEPVDK